MNRRRGGALLSVALLAFAVTPVTAADADDTVRAFRVIASPFTSDAVSTRNAAGIRLNLARRARVTLTIEAVGGAIVRHVVSGRRLAKGGHRWRWYGRDDGGEFVADGDYIAHVIVRNKLGTDERTLPLRKGMPPIYAANPGAIIVLVYPVEHGFQYYAVGTGLQVGRDFVVVRSEEALDEAVRANGAGHLMLVTTFPRALRLDKPELHARVQAGWTPVKEFPATIHDGSITVWLPRQT